MKLHMKLHDAAQHHIFATGQLSMDECAAITSAALLGMDDGELFIEKRFSDQMLWDDGRLKQANSSSANGFGLRAILGEATAYAHASGMSQKKLAEAASTVQLLQKAGKHAENVNIPLPDQDVTALYDADNPITSLSSQEKITLLGKIDGYLRRKDNRVRQVSVSSYAEWQLVALYHPKDGWKSDVRPLVRLNISVVAEQDGRIERGSAGAGGRFGLEHYREDQQWLPLADEALRQALVNLEAIPAPAGEYPVVLGSGWPGVLLHEAVGHGLEGDFNRKETSAFYDKIGQSVAAKGVTVIDDGTIHGRRGSITIDDEGTKSQRTILIEDGILRGFLFDRLNARLMGTSSTGNGRRESYAHAPMPRMTNTMMLSGNSTRDAMIRDVEYGIYAPHFGGGQVDITSGKFVFSASEAYLIEKGQITSPIKGATMIGNGPDLLTRITAIGNDSCLDDGIGTCGKAGQSVPVGVGQPSMLIDGMTIGGTAA